MKNMTELISWFQMEYPYLVQDMRNATHHLTTNDCLDNELDYSEPRCKPQSLNPYHLEGSVFCHTMMVCKQAENAFYEVQIAALLHDIGKPSTRKINAKNGNVSFYNHDAVSAFMALEILNRPELELREEQKVLIFNMIALHTQIYKLSVEQLYNMGDIYLVHHLIELGKADHAGRFYTEGDAVIPDISEIKPISGVSSTVRGSFDKEKEVIVLCGLPGSGKSTWVRNEMRKDENFGDYVISRDYHVENNGTTHDYNKSWQEVDHKFIDKLVQTDFKLAKECDSVIVDMTHMSKKSRRKSLSHFGSDYKKKCVVFLPDLPKLFLQNEQRDGKVIDKSVIERMMRSFYPPTYEEFDEIEYII